MAELLATFGWPALALVSIAYAAVDFAWGWRHRDRVGLLRGWVTDLWIVMVGEGLRFATRGAVLALFVALSTLAPRHLWPSGALGVVLVYLACDLTLYLWHRACHAHPWLWALHAVHHSASSVRVSVGGRISWALHAVDDLVYAPWVLLGADPVALMTWMTLDRWAQLWPHVEWIGPLRWLDPWMNTPANHRVHHHRDGLGSAHNFGSHLMVWDHLFGTYRSEADALRALDGPPRYGVEGLTSDVPTADERRVPESPLRVQLAGLRALWAARRERP